MFTSLSRCANPLAEFKKVGGQSASKATNYLGVVPAFLVYGYAAFYCLRNCYYSVPAGSRAIVFSRLRGVEEGVKGEGFHLRLPWIERPIIYDCRARARSIASATGSRDLQMVNITLRVLSRPNANQLPKIYEMLGVDWDDRVLPSIVNEVLKTNVAKYTASDLITQREHVSQLILNDLKQRAREFNLVIDDCSITHCTFSQQYNKAIEEKQVAQQEAERAKYLVEKALQDKRTVITRAEGHAAAAQLIGEAVQRNPAFVSIRQMETAEEVANSLQKSGNKMFLNSDNLLLKLPTIDY